MPIKALMVDVDGVLIVGRPEDGGRWHAAIEDDLGFARSTLQEQFFLPYWDDILVGRTGLMEQLAAAMQTFAPNVSPEKFVSYWFERDSRIAKPLLAKISAIRAGGIRVYLATNQWQTLHWTRDSSPDIVQNLCASL